MKLLREKNKEVLSCLFFGQLILLYLPTCKFFSIQTDNGTIPASACYFFSLLFVPFILKSFKQNGLKLPPLYITGLFGYVMILAIVQMGQYGVSKSVLHWLFGFYLLIIIVNLGQYFLKEEWLRILEWGAILFAILHFIFMLQNYETVCLLCKNYFWGIWSSYEASILPSLTRGGRNLDATWLALGSVFVSGKKKVLYVTYVVLFVFMGGSRVGIISLGLACVWGLFYEKDYKLSKKNSKWYALYAIIMLTVLFMTGFAQATLARVLIDVDSPVEVLHISKDEISVDGSAIDNVDTLLGIYNGDSSAVVLSGRKDIWTRVPQMIKDNPFGYGVGNAMRVMRTQYGFTSYEDVIHNVFMQWTVDEGIIGGLWYILLVCLLFFRQWKNRPCFFKNRLDVYLGIYIVLSLVQFHGAEALMIYVLGVYFLEHDTKYIVIPNFWKKKVS